MTTADRAARLANTVLTVAVIPLLHRMQNELDRNGTLRRGTQMMMWAAYATFGVLLTESLARHRDVPTGRRGTTLAGAGMTPFDSPQ
ncbi:hypothetical protein ACFU8R_25580 [Pseudonocardia alni]|jgi:hypothetical protein|uniref:Uncharacterized protein n=1 Tax=Pseudonocardia alni TaxID=33907 RepID=A0A852WA09_PSEA5|nr:MULTISPECIES: hypothetical protein [Pseudonocardia]MCO7191618.1 hypothetical protein [Pseudonocardia sp. McavD-2-B]NYG05450.1 hypothetical protein [Pseudonocardia antarctica]